MCHFITLIVPTDNAALVRSVVDRHGRTAEPIDNPSIRKLLNDGECQYLTTRGHCDCGTVLAPRGDTIHSLDEKLAKEVARLRRKGWSETKIARATSGRRKTDVPPHGGGSDSIELWNAVLSDLCRELKLPCAGLLVKLYTGEIATEAFSASRRVVAKNTPWRDALASMKLDEVTIFQLS